MKKIYMILFVLIIIVILVSVSFIMIKRSGNEVDSNKVGLMSFGDYKNINVDNITKIEIHRYTEGGLDSETITGLDEIKNIYNSLSLKNIGNETMESCEDNTIVYIIFTNNEKEYSIEIECNVLIYNGKRYKVK